MNGIVVLNELLDEPRAAADRALKTRHVRVEEKLLVSSADRIAIARSGMTSP